MYATELGITSMKNEKKLAKSQSLMVITAHCPCGYPEEVLSTKSS